VVVNKNKLINSAQKFIQKGNYEKALREYNKIIEQDPKDERIRLKVAEICARLGRKEEAIQHYRKVADSYSKQGFYVKAVAVLKQVLKLDDNYLEGMMKLGELYQQLGLISDAMIQFQHVVEKFESSGNIDQALQVLEQMTELDPENFQARLRYAQALVRAERRDEALDLYKQLADELKGSNNFDDYLRVLELLSQATPEDHDTLRELAEIYINRGEIKRALTKLQICFQEDPQNAETLLLLAKAFRSLGQDAKLLSVYHELVRVYEAQGRNNERDAIYQKILALNPGDVEARTALEKETDSAQDGEDFFLEDESGSMDGFEIPSVMPNNPENGFEAPTIMAGPSPAVKKAPTSTATLDRDPEVEKKLTEADVFIKYGLMDRAKSHIMESLENHPGSILLHEKLVQILTNMEETDAAVAELETLVEMAKELGDLDLTAKYTAQIAELKPGSENAGVPGMDYTDGFEEEAADEDVIELGIDNEIEEFSIDETGDLESLDVENFSFDEGLDFQPLSEDELYGEPRSEDGESQDTNESFSEPGTGAESDKDDWSLDTSEKQEPAIGLSFDEPSLLGMAPEDLFQQESRESATDDNASNKSAVNKDTAPDDEEDFSDEIEEANFFIQQNLYDDARALLEEILAKSPGHAEATALIARIQDIEGKNNKQETIAGNSSSDAKPAPDKKPAVNDGYDKSFGSDFLDDEEMTQTTATEELGREDHFDVGMAYFGMAMYDEAVREFKIAVKAHDGREADCYKMIGLSAKAQGKLKEAVSVFKQGLKIEGATNAQKLDIYYELGDVLEDMGRRKDAKRCFTRIYREDRKFRDVVKKLKDLAIPGEGSGN